MPRSGIAASDSLVTNAPTRGVEAEIAVLLRESLPPRDAAYTRVDVLAAIASAHPAIEVLHSRFQDPDAVDPLSMLADSLAHLAFVHGAPVPDWQAVDLAAEEVVVLMDGAEVKRRTANPAGDMIRLLVWLANEGSVWAGGLQAGQWITTGSWTGKDYAPPGAQVEMRFRSMGSVVVRFP